MSSMIFCATCAIIRLYTTAVALYPCFVEQMTREGRPLPACVRAAFEAYLRCGLLEHGFLSVQCTSCHPERLVAFSCKRRGFCPSCGARRMAETSALLVDDILPPHPIRQWVLSFPFALRYLFATRPATLSRVLAIVYRAIARRYAGAAGVAVSQGHTGSVTLIQRFGSALNLNVHLHMLFLDGVYVERDDKPRFRRVSAPVKTELEVLVHQISQRVGRHLERKGLLERDLESSQLTLDPADENDGMNALLGHSITYRVAVGPRAGQKAFTLQTLPPLTEHHDDEPPYLAKANGFSLHAGVCAQAFERDKLERLCRYITRPPVADQRISLTPNGNIRYELKTPYRDGTTHVVLDPMDFMPQGTFSIAVRSHLVARLAALVPRPRVNLTRY
ncbi:MAG: transposase, partial [Lysobacterales bacterium]